MADDFKKVWYAFKPALFELIKYSKSRELMFLGNVKVRWLRAMSVDYFKVILETFDIYKKPNTCYCSLDHIKQIPLFTANLSQRKKQTDEWLLNEAKITGVDFGIDIDNKKGWRSCEKQLYDLLEIFEKSGVVYSVWCSLGKGFHIIIPDEEISLFTSATPEQKINIYYNIATKLKKTIIPDLDLSAYMKTRVFKTPYSVASNGEVILPLYYKDLKKLFDGSMKLTPDWIMRNVHIMNRGVFINGRTGNFKKFLEEVENL